jgi:hypothetical protein
MKIEGGFTWEEEVAEEEIGQKVMGWIWSKHTIYMCESVTMKPLFCVINIC